MSGFLSRPEKKNQEMPEYINKSSYPQVHDNVFKNRPCANCNQLGHWKDDCPMPKNTEAQAKYFADVACHRCTKKSHHTSECREPMITCNVCDGKHCALNCRINRLHMRVVCMILQVVKREKKEEDVSAAIMAVIRGDPAGVSDLQNWINHPGCNCDKCGASKHYTEDCILCIRCKQWGHLAADCTTETLTLACLKCGGDHYTSECTSTGDGRKVICDKIVKEIDSLVSIRTISPETAEFVDRIKQFVSDILNFHQEVIEEKTAQAREQQRIEQQRIGVRNTAVGAKRPNVLQNPFRPGGVSSAMPQRQPAGLGLSRYAGVSMSPQSTQLQ